MSVLRGLRWNLWVAVLASIIFFVALTLLIIGTAYSHDPQHYPNMSTAQLEWFRSQRVPKPGGGLCCNEFDGVEAEEDIRDGTYWTRWMPGQDWMRVPPEAVLNSRNPNGAPVVWFGYNTVEGRKRYFIRCYAPGSGT